MPERDASEHAIFGELDLLDEAEQLAVPVPAAPHVGGWDLEWWKPTTEPVPQVCWTTTRSVVTRSMREHEPAVHRHEGTPTPNTAFCAIRRTQPTVALIANTRRSAFL